MKKLLRLKKIDAYTLEENITQIVKGKVTVNVVDLQVSVDIVYRDYLFSMLKQDLANISNLFEYFKIKTATVTLTMPEGHKIIYIQKVDAKDSGLLIDLYETTKSILPSAKNIVVSNSSIEYSLENETLITLTGTKICTMLTEFFSEDYSNFILKINVPNITIQYSFKWLVNDIIQETFVNSNRYFEMLEFLKEHPNPKVKQFRFLFRDSNKGFYAELDCVYTENLTKAETLESNEFIRAKLNEKFSYLPVF